MMKSQKLKIKCQRLSLALGILDMAFLLFVIYNLLFTPLALATSPQSTHFILPEYGFGAGGSSNSASLNFGVFGSLGDVDMGSPSSSLFRLNAGLEFMAMSSTPPAPTLSNPATNYDRLMIVINPVSGAPTDVKYAIAISTDGFVNDIRYIKSDKTIGPTLTGSDFLDYTTGWGGSSGTFISGLISATTYTIRVKARQGNFSDSFWSPVSSSIATSNPTLTFGLDTSSITFSNLNTGNSFTDASKQTVLTTSTNAYNGYVIYAKETQPLSYLTNTIADYGSPNSAPTAWSGTGFGYSTTDNDLPTGGTNTRFNNGTNYAGFTTSQQDPVADHTTVIQNPTLTNESFTIKYEVAAPSTIAAGNYTNTIIYTIVPTY